MAIQYKVDQHVVCKLGGLLAENYGEYTVSLKITENTDNGKIVKVGKMDSLDLYTIEAATTLGGYIYDQAADGTWLVVITSVPDDLTALIYQKPLINEESPRRLTSISNFYNDPEDGAVRGYVLHPLDRFYLSADGFEGTPSKGKEFTAIENGKIKIDG